MNKSKVDFGEEIIEDAEAETDSGAKCSRCGEGVLRCYGCGGFFSANAGEGSIVCARTHYENILLDRYAHYCRACDPRKQVSKK